jgi:hypothetical protein
MVICNDAVVACEGVVVVAMIPLVRGRRCVVVVLHEEVATVRKEGSARTTW